MVRKVALMSDVPLCVDACCAQGDRVPIFDSAVSDRTVRQHLHLMADPGELFFTKLCAATQLACERIKEASHIGEKRPDFRVVGTDGSTFVAEVKTFAPNSKERGELRRKEAGEIVVYGGEPGERLRRTIRRANRQLRTLTAGKLPGVLVVFTTEVHLRWHTDPYSVLTAMRGLDVVPVHVPADPTMQPTFGEVRSGPGKQMTADANTSTSAIVCPRSLDDVEWEVHVFHNSHAATPLPTSALSRAQFRHWRIADNERDWIEVPRPGTATQAIHDEPAA